MENAKEFEFTVSCKNCKVTLKSKYPNVLPLELDFGSCHACTPEELINAEHDLTDKKIDLGREFDKINYDRKKAFIDEGMYKPLCDYINLYNQLKPANYPLEDLPENPAEKEELLHG